MSEVVPKPVPHREPERRPKRVRSPMPRIDGVSEPWRPWADVLEGVFHVDGFRRPTRGQRMKAQCLVQGRATSKVVDGLLKATRQP